MTSEELKLEKINMVFILWKWVEIPITPMENFANGFYLWIANAGYILTQMGITLPSPNLKAIPGSRYEPGMTSE